MKSLISECCGYALVVVVVLTSSTLIFAEEKGDDSAPEKGPPAETGFLFIDGQYVSPPYIFRTDESGVSVNGISIAYTSLGLGERDFFKWEIVPREATSDQAEPEVTYRRKSIRH